MAFLLYAEIHILCILIFAILLFKVATGFDKSNRQIIFCSLLVSCLCTFVFDFVWMSIDGLPGPHTAAYVYAANVLYYLALGASGYLWLLYTLAVQNSKLIAQRHSLIWMGIPLAVLVVMTLLTPFTGWLFYVDANGFYVRGPLHFVQLLISFGYLAAAFASLLLKGWRSKSYQERKKLFEMAAYMTPLFIAGILQAVLPVGVPAIAGGSTVSLLFIYVMLQEQHISIDPLTKVNNRNQLMRHLESRMARVADGADEDEDPLTLIILDVDKFKQINDRYGHPEGDQALIRVGRALRSVGREYRMGIFRYGGDEFVLSFPGTAEQAEQVVADINFTLAVLDEQAGAPYRLRMSAGCEEYDPSILTPQEFLKRADAKLYEAKKAVNQAELAAKQAAKLQEVQQQIAASRPDRDDRDAGGVSYLASPEDQETP